MFLHFHQVFVTYVSPAQISKDPGTGLVDPDIGLVDRGLGLVDSLHGFVDPGPSLVDLWAWLN